MGITAGFAHRFAAGAGGAEQGENDRRRNALHGLRHRRRLPRRCVDLRAQRSKEIAPVVEAGRVGPYVRHGFNPRRAQFADDVHACVAGGPGDQSTHRLGVSHDRPPGPAASFALVFPSV